MADDAAGPIERGEVPIREFMQADGLCMIVLPMNATLTVTGSNFSQQQCTESSLEAG